MCLSRSYKNSDGYVGYIYTYILPACSTVLLEKLPFAASQEIPRSL